MFESDSEEEALDLIHRIKVSANFKRFITETKQMPFRSLSSNKVTNNMCDSTLCPYINANNNGQKSDESPSLLDTSVHSLQKSVTQILDELVDKVAEQLSLLCITDNRVNEVPTDGQEIRAKQFHKPLFPQKKKKLRLILSDSDSDSENEYQSKGQPVSGKASPFIKTLHSFNNLNTKSFDKSLVDITDDSVSGDHQYHQLIPSIDLVLWQELPFMDDFYEVIDVSSDEDHFPNNNSIQEWVDSNDHQYQSDVSPNKSDNLQVLSDSDQSGDSHNSHNSLLEDIFLNKYAERVKSSAKPQTKPKASAKPVDQRRDIKSIIDVESLNTQTINSRKKENQRIGRLIKRLRNWGLKIESSDNFVDIDGEDPNNLIQHKNDTFNVTAKGEPVLVNVGHSEDEPNIYLAPEIAKVVKPHQVGGIRFLFDNLIESVNGFDLKEGFGCVLSHSMGLGKTLQIIAIVDIFLKQTTAKTVMIVLPVNVLNNWFFEFNKWLPERHREFEIYSIDKLNIRARNRLLSNWHNSGGVLLIGYEKFSRIITDCEKKFSDPDDYMAAEIRDAKQLMSALVNPGPHLVVCDEGHRIKNDDTGISRALKKINTKRRVILTGYPLQNKLKEYYCMIDFVRPNYLGLKWEFKNNFETPITNGQCKDSTEFDKKLMRERSHVLSQLLKGFVQRRTEDVMKQFLPDKHEFVVFCKLSKKQREMIHHFLNQVLSNKVDDTTGSISLFRTFVVCSKICNHPDIIHKTLQSGSANEELDPEEQPQLLAYSWAKEHFNDYETEVLSFSSKMVLLFEIIDETVAKNQRLLIFSQWLFTLDLIETLLESRNIFDSQTKWRKYRSYYRLDGQTKADEREELINKFNSEDNHGVHLFLISTKAGGIGINLTGANRIVIFDACWNPCHDAQASCRIYRPGQSKKCYIYRLISENSLEKRIFNKQILKQAMSKGVVDQQNIDLKLNQNQVRALIFELRKELEDIDDNDCVTHNQLQQLKETDPLLSSVCERSKSLVASIAFEMDSYLSVDKNLALTSAQKREAIESYNQTEKLTLNMKPNYQRTDADLENLSQSLSKTKI